MILTHGQKLVGLTFNPSGDEKVNKVKQLYSEIIDMILKEDITSDDKSRMLNVALNESQTAQMWAVKVFTWRD